MAENRKQLVLDVMDGKSVPRVPVGFWFHFLENETKSNAIENPELTEELLAGERKFIEEVKPDLVKIMTDGFFHHPYKKISNARSVKDLVGLSPLDDDDSWFKNQVTYASELVKAYGDEVTLFYNVFAPSAIVRFMQPADVDGEALLASFVREDKDALKNALDVIANDVARLAEKVILEAGVTGIYLSVQNVIGEGVTREVYDELFASGEKKILTAANRASRYNILHICGYAGHRNDLTWYQDYEVRAVNWAAVVEGVPLEEGRKLFPHSTLIGGFANGRDDIIASGTKEAVTEETRRLLQQAGREGVILGADCTLPSDVEWRRWDWVREAAL